MLVEQIDGAFLAATVAQDGTMLASGVLTGGSGMVLVGILSGGALSPQFGPMGVYSDPTLRFGSAIEATTDHRVVVAAQATDGPRLLRFWY